MAFDACIRGRTTASEVAPDAALLALGKPSIKDCRMILLECIHRHFVLVASLLLSSACALAAEPFTMSRLVLLQPETVIWQRLPSVAAFTDYISRLRGSMATALQSTTEGVPAAGFVLIAMRPDGSRRAWLDFDSAVPHVVATTLRSAALDVPPPGVTQGVVVFAMGVRLWGAHASATDQPYPPAWQKALAGAASAGMDAGQLAELAWDVE